MASCLFLMLACRETAFTSGVDALKLLVRDRCTKTTVHGVRPGRRIHVHYTTGRRDVYAHGVMDNTDSMSLAAHAHAEGRFIRASNSVYRLTKGHIDSGGTRDRAIYICVCGDKKMHTAFLDYLYYVV